MNGSRSTPEPNIGEVFPDPVSPLTFEWFENSDGIGSAEWGFRDAYHRIGVLSPDEVPADRAVFLGVFGGYGYLNASALRLLGHRAPGMTAQDIDDAFFGNAPGVPPFVAGDGDDRPDLTEKIAATFQWALSTPDLPDVAADEALMNEIRAARPDLRAMSDRELVDHAWALLDTHFARLFSQHIYITFLSSVPVGIITKVAAALGRPGDALKLIAGTGDVESAAPSAVLWRMGRTVAASEPLTALFDAGIVEIDARLRACSHPDALDLAEQFDRFLVG